MGGAAKWKRETALRAVRDAEARATAEGRGLTLSAKIAAAALACGSANTACMVLGARGGIRIEYAQDAPRRVTDLADPLLSPLAALVGGATPRPQLRPGTLWAFEDGTRIVVDKGSGKFARVLDTAVFDPATTAAVEALW